MDITLQVMAKPPAHDLSYNAGKAARRILKGDVVHVYKRSQCPEPPSPSSRMVFVHITDVPVTAIDKARALMTGQTQTEPGEVVGEWNVVTLKRRRWNIADADLPAAARVALRDNREVTVTWDKTKAYLKDKVTDAYATNESLNG